MMFPMEKCAGQSGSGISSQSDLTGPPTQGIGKESQTDEVASAVAAVSDEIGDILKDELDADRAERIGAELADLSAELGLLAGLADGDQQQAFPSTFELSIGHRGSASGSSSSSWSGGRGGRRVARPQRTARRRPIAKGKEASRRRAVAARRAATARSRRGDGCDGSDASDVGADSDSDDQWTELDEHTGSSDNSLAKEAPNVGEIEYQEKAAEAPAMGQFLLPLLSAEPNSADAEHFLIRHEDILQLLASAEESVRDEITIQENYTFDDDPDAISGHSSDEEPPVTPEEEAALLQYVCAELNGDSTEFSPVEDWLMGMFHSWCEISAIMYSLAGTSMNLARMTEPWVYKATFGCHCGLCLCLANGGGAIAAFLRDVVWALAHGGNTAGVAAGVVRALRLSADEPSPPHSWDIARLRRLNFLSDGERIIHDQLSRLAEKGDIAAQLVDKICLCRPYQQPTDQGHAVDRFCSLLENFKAVSTISIKVDMIPGNAATSEWLEKTRRRLSRYLGMISKASTVKRLKDMRARTTTDDIDAWSGYKHRCDCLTPRTLCAEQRKQLLRISFFGVMQAVNEANVASKATERSGETDVKAPADDLDKPPDSSEGQPANETHNSEHSDCDPAAEKEDGDFNDMTDSDTNTPSLGLSTSSSLDSASELLLAAAAAVDSGGSESEAAPGELCRTVRHLMRSIASIERLMDRVLKHCDEWPAPANKNDSEARKRVDMGLTEVDRKLMAMYKRLPEVHRRQLQVYRKQKKLSSVCMQLVGGSAPAPPGPGSPPGAAPRAACRSLCPEYHLARCREVRRKVMHMRDQQLYYHRLRMWLEEQLKLERKSLPEGSLKLLEELPRRKRRTRSPKAPRLATASKRRHKSSSALSKPQKILQMLMQKAPAHTTKLLTDSIKSDEERELAKSEVEPPEAFPLDRDDNISDAETIVGEKETGDLCKEMNECLAKFANFALSNDSNVTDDAKYPESVSPPLQEMSPTTSEPVFKPKPTQRLMTVNKFLTDKDFQAPIAPDLNAPLNARKTVKEESNVTITQEKQDSKEEEDEDSIDKNKYVSFGLEIKKAMEECKTIIGSYNSISDDEEEKLDGETPSYEQICEAVMSLDQSSIELLDKVGTNEDIDVITNPKFMEFVENMPQLLATMPEIASKLSELSIANASFELPEFDSIINSLPDESQLTPETLKQIRELKLSKARDSIKVTKNTTRRKLKSRSRTIVDTEVISTVSFEIETKDVSDLLKDVVVTKVFEYLKETNSPELAKCLEDDADLMSLPNTAINTEMYEKACTLFDNSVKHVYSMLELRDLVKTRVGSWKHYVASKFQSIPTELLENEIESILDKFYIYIQDLADRQGSNDADVIKEKIEELKRAQLEEFKKHQDLLGLDSSEESIQQITRVLSASINSTFDLIITKLHTMPEDQKVPVLNLKFKYIDVVKKCAESQSLSSWLLANPESSCNTILELTGLPVKKPKKPLDFSTWPHEKRKDYFFDRYKLMNRLYMDSLPKDSMTGDDWLVMLYRLEQLEISLKEAFQKIAPPPPPAKTQNNASEAEILAGKGLSKLISKANVRTVKKPEAAPLKPIKKEDLKDKLDLSKFKTRNEVLLAKCEAILTSKGEKSLLDSFYAIKSYITQGKPVPEVYKKQVASICSSVDANLLDEDVAEIKKFTEKLEKEKGGREKTTSPVDQNPELLAKYSAQALRNARQTLNTVAFRNMMRNGQTKSESDACDTPKNDCKWTSDCVCSSCKSNDSNSVCLGEIVKQCYDKKVKTSLEEKKIQKETKSKPVAKSLKQPPKACEGVSHQQHICKVGHGVNACSGEGGPEQPCNCCYCTVFGHAPPLTTPVPRNYNETRERLRSILNKKKQQCKVTNGEHETQDKKPVPPQPSPPAEPPQTSPKPPALPKTLPPNLTPAAQQKRALDAQQRQLADKMAKMAVTEKPEDKVKMCKPIAVQTTLTASMMSEGKVNPNAMEQIRIQQLKNQQAQLHQQKQKQKPEPIYDLPIHNKPPMTAQQQQQQQTQAKQQQMPQAKPQQVKQQPLEQQKQQQMQQQYLQQQQLKQQQQQHAQQQHAQQLHAQTLQAQQLLQQKLQARQARPQQPRTAVSLSSRDTSVFSTSSGCSGGSCWRGSRTEDPRDLDALLQYIEGPARHIDRGKKKAKKQRQKAKKLEVRLLEEREVLIGELFYARGSAQVFRYAHDNAAKRLKEARRLLPARPKGKKQKLSPAQQSKVQQVAEELGELNTLMNATAKDMAAAEKKIAEWTQKLEACDKHLAEARALQGKPHTQLDLREFKQHKDNQNWDQLREKTNRAGDRHMDTTNAQNEDQQVNRQTESQRKQTWEQALAHMNQLAKGNKEKQKKKKEIVVQQQQQKQTQQQQPQQQMQKHKQQVQEVPVAKTKKQSAGQKNEEVECKKKPQPEPKQKKTETKKPEPPPKPEPKRVEKKQEPKKQEPPKKKEKNEKKDPEKKGKENKQEKNVTSAAKQTKQAATQPPQNKKEPKKKEPKEGHKLQVVNITPDTTIEIVNNKPKNQSAGEPEKAASCSIMEQLSCGVQVADLRLPPGITLTRVHPNEKKEPPTIKSVPAWKGGSLVQTPTPEARPPPVIHADPTLMLFTPAHAEPPKTIIVPEPPPPASIPKSKKSKKKSKKTTTEPEIKQEPKMVTLRNPMFHANVPPVQVTTAPAQKKADPGIRIPDPIPMPPNACQATITPTSNGMYTIRNPLMSMMHQQSLMGIRSQTPQMNPAYGQQFNYVNPNVYNPVQSAPAQYAAERTSPKCQDDLQNRILNLASFTQKNDEGYSLFKTNDDQQQRSFLSPEFYVEDNAQKNVISPNPIGTRPNNDHRDTRLFDSNDSSLFSNPSRPEPIGTPLKRDEERNEYTGLYTPFGQEDRNVFRNALFNDKVDVGSNIGRSETDYINHLNGDSLPYFQRLRVGSKLNNEVTIHHVTESKFYKGQDPESESLFSRSAWPPHHMGNAGLGCSLSAPPSRPESRASPEETGFGAVGSRTQPRPDPLLL